MRRRTFPLLAATIRLMIGASVRWVDCQPAEDARVYYANHTSHMDFVVLWASLPPEVRARSRPVAAQDYWESGRVRAYCGKKIFRAVLVDRIAAHCDAQHRANTRAAVEHMRSVLDNGESLIIFPEGTRGDGESVAAFKSGIYHLAQYRPDVELVPVFLQNLNRILPKGEVLPVPLIAQVTFGPPLRLCDGEPKPAFLERAHRALCALKEL